MLRVLQCTRSFQPKKRWPVLARRRVRAKSASRARNCHEYWRIDPRLYQEPFAEAMMTCTPIFFIDFANIEWDAINTEDAVMQAKPPKRGRSRSGACSDAESSGDSEAEDDDDDVDRETKKATTAAVQAKVRLILMAKKLPSPHQQRTKAVSPKGHSQSFALQNSTCKCLMGHNMTVLQTEFKSKTPFTCNI